jgi:hypothetical protein
MKNKFLISLTITHAVLLLGCNLGETSKLEKSLKVVIKENDCLIGLKSTKTNNTKHLVLTTKCENNSSLFYGKVLFDYISNINKDGLYFDNYTIENNSNQEIISFNKDEWRVILDKEKLFNKVVNKLENKNFKDCYELLADEIKTQIEFEDFKSSIVPLINDNYKQFEGLTLLSQEGKKYISFSRTNGINRVIITFLLDLDDDVIYGYSSN